MMRSQNLRRWALRLYWSQWSTSSRFVGEKFARSSLVPKHWRSLQLKKNGCLGDGFNFFLMFTLIWGKIPILTNIFTSWLKPPTSCFWAHPRIVRVTTRTTYHLWSEVPCKPSCAIVTGWGGRSKVVFLVSSWNSCLCFFWRFTDSSMVNHLK